MRLRKSFYRLLLSGMLAALAGFLGCSPSSSRVEKRSRALALQIAGIPNGDRTDYGQSPWPLWSILTSAESQTLARLPEAKSGDPAALFRLGLLASGDERNETEYSHSLSVVAEFVELLQAKLPDNLSEKEKAKRLFEAMHVRFFGSEKGRSLRNYEFAQSSLTGVFRDRRFNCISSTMLYLVLCRHFDLEAKGVLLPGHVFVQINFRDGSKVEVETTVMEGFGITHDAAFYRNQSPWFKRLYTERPTFEAYQKRTILEPWQVMTENMANQHTDVERMNMRDIFRLQEIRSHCWPENPEFALGRLSSYSLEMAHLQKNLQWRELVQFSEKVLPWIQELKKHRVGDTAFTMRIAFFHSAHAVALIHIGQPEDAKKWVDESLAWANPASPDYRDLVQTGYSVMAMRWQALVDKGEYALTEKEINRYREICPVQEACPEQRLWLYSQWTKSLWDKEKWEEVVAKVKLSMSFAGDSTQQYKQALDGAYSNWANFYFKAEQYGEGRKILERCLKESAENKSCAESLERLRQAGL